MKRHKATIIFLFSLMIISCDNLKSRTRKVHTPKEYLNVTKMNADGYAKDKDILERQIKALVDSHEQSFNSKEYFDSTELEIDTILYDNSYQKIIVFILIRNPITRQIVPNKNYDWYYDAYCYLGIRQNDEFKLKWMQPFSLINFYNSKEALKYIKDQYFTEFATIKDANGLLINKYNLDDSRFWGTPIWRDSF